MFEARTRIEVVDEILRSIEVLTDEARFQFQPDGLSTPVTDLANVGKSNIWIGSNGFDTYESGRITLGISTEKLRTIVNLSDKNQDVFLKVYPKEQRLLVDVEGWEHRIGLYDPKTIPKYSEPLNIEVPAIVSLSKREFTRSIESASAFADHIVFSMSEKENRFQMIARGDTDDFRKIWDESELDLFTPDDVQSRYSLDYLKDLSDAIPDESDVCIKFDDDYPAIFQYEIVGGNGQVDFFLAPHLGNSNN